MAEVEKQEKQEESSEESKEEGDSKTSLVTDEKKEEGDSKTSLVTDEKKEEGDGKTSDDKSEKEGAPEKYEDFKLPDGMEMDKESLEKFLPLAKELDLTQEEAQKLIDFKSDAKKEESQKQWDHWENTQKEWVEDSRNDKEIGGEKFEENLAVAKKALDAYGNEALKDLADATGVGNNKEFIRFLVKVGKDISEDKLRISGAMTKEGSRASRIYDKTN